MASRPLSEFKLPRLKLDCLDCGRAGDYDVRRAIQQHGDITIADFIRNIARSCPRWSDDPDKNPCGAACYDLAYMFASLPFSDDWKKNDKPS